MYYKPCILISHTNGVGKGSGRSIKGFNLFDALTHCEKQLIDFGGHAVAAGLNVNMSDIDSFIKEINKYADEVLTEQDMIPTVDIHNLCVCKCEYGLFVVHTERLKF